MGKEKRALERVKKFMSVNAVHWKQDIAILEEALKEREMYRMICNTSFHFIFILEKWIQALEIIKEKRVDIATLFDCDNAEEYNRWVFVRSHYTYRPFELTQKEYDFLKGVLSDDSGIAKIEARRAVETYKLFKDSCF